MMLSTCAVIMQLSYLIHDLVDSTLSQRHCCLQKGVQGSLQQPDWQEGSGPGELPKARVSDSMYVGCESWLYNGFVPQADSEVLDRKMAALQADIGEQAAEVHRNHKFNSGATEPTGESSPTKLASGLLGTAEVCTHSHASS